MQSVWRPGRPVFAALAALVCFAASAHAQTTLTVGSGDSVTVAAAGTEGLQGGQRTVGNSVSTYRAGDGGAAVRTVGTGSFALNSGAALSAGSGGAGLVAGGSSPVLILGGDLSAGSGGSGLRSEGTGRVLITGGTFTGGDNGYGVYASGSGPVSIYGGEFSAGTGGYGLSTVGSGVLELVSRGSSDFLFTDAAGRTTALSNAALPSGASGTLSGTLLFGVSPFEATVFNGGTVILRTGTPASAAPEPSALAVWALLGLGGTGLALRARRRKAA